MKKLFILIAAVAVSFYAVKNMDGGGNIKVYRGGDTFQSTNLSDYLPDLSALMNNDQVDLRQVNDQLITAFPEAFKWAEATANDVAGTMAQDAMNLAATQSHGEILANFDISHQACQRCHDAAKRISGQ